jgi:hypothetical protein
LKSGNNRSRGLIAMWTHIFLENFCARVNYVQQFGTADQEIWSQILRLKSLPGFWKVGAVANCWKSNLWKSYSVSHNCRSWYGSLASNFRLDLPGRSLELDLHAALSPGSPSSAARSRLLECSNDPGDAMRANV